MVQQHSSWQQRRRQMVERQLVRRGIRDRRVLSAMLEIPRERFVPEAVRGACYEDEPVPIGHGQTISQPYITALMAQCLELEGHETVLEIGAGCGYHTALLARLAARVIAIEIVPALAEMARQNLSAAGHDSNVELICGDGSMGWPREAPYQGVSVAAAAPEVPFALLDQLGDPGRLVIPVGTLADQDLRVITRSQGRLETRVASMCRFVPLRGRQGWK